MNVLNTDEIVRLRGPKNAVSVDRPYAFIHERERAADGEVVDVATIFLTNRECPFRCLMCDLWKNTTDATVPPGAIASQIRYALARLPTASHIKLYNSGNFFDHRAIPRADYDEIAAICKPFANVVVESHPKLLGDDCRAFRDMVGGTLEVAMGLETIDPELVARLNKQMTLDDFVAGAEFLNEHAIGSRAFVLLKPPYTSEQSGIDWAVRSARFAFDHAVECVAVIPTRSGNGALDLLQKQGDFAPPTLKSLETVADTLLPERRGRTFVDLWDAERFAECDLCVGKRIVRLNEMNFEQRVLPAVVCSCDELPQP